MSIEVIIITKHKNTYYTIRKNNIDICKIVFVKGKRGLFDIEISFYRQKFNIKTFKLFNKRSEVFSIDDTENRQITYHYGKDGRKIVIHTKRIDGEPNYKDILLGNVTPPSSNSLFMLPLFKIEVGNSYNGPLSFEDNNIGNLIDIREDNVVEIYMLQNELFIENNHKKYDIAYELESLFPMEYLTSNNAYTGTDKNKYFLGKNGFHQSRRTKDGKKFNLYIDGFYNPYVDCVVKEPTITFFENELYEEIILNTIKNPVIDNKDIINDNGTTYLTINNYDSFDINKPISKDSIGGRIYYDYLNNKIEKDMFLGRYLLARKKLYNRLCLFSLELNLARYIIDNKCNRFLNAITYLYLYYFNKYKDLDCDCDITDEIGWILEPDIFKMEDI